MKLIATNRKFESGNFKITIGTTNKKKPITFYIELNCTASLVDKKKIDNDMIKKISSEIKKISSAVVKDYSMEKCSISTIDFSEESLKNGKSAHLTIQFYFMQLFTTNFDRLCVVCEKLADKYTPVLKNKLLEYNIDIKKTK
jgi:hypothetical protein